ncbi:MAG TPA: aldo/keto reductase [Devosia sp.]|jgi:aryl-alcohol dehydrogenase-like predicted oxidoreductase|uniref:aldo/keto reductase n=1 Tax=Devosia sp. TaxID=1871048 RepID=UPI002DDCCD1A|nr:aldo/keto reductase [Devosia sp.]HEV2515367.1 aldo/keto reductase [Devosia sp.]
MDRRKLGKTGYEVSEIGLGTWQLGESFGPVSDESAAEILKTARSAEVNFWDTADVYGGGQSEQRIGAFKDKKGVFVATKLGRNGEIFPDKTGYNKKNIKESLAGSLKRLGVETLDLAQLHTIPTDVLRDGEVFTIMDDLRDAGMMRHWGASVENVEEALLAMKSDGCTTLQIIFNLFRQDYITEVFPTATKRNVGIIVRLPLASGLLSGKWTKETRFAATDHRNFNANGEKFNVGETFSGLPFDKGVGFAEQLKQMIPTGIPLSQFALRWILDQPAVSTIIAGVTRPDQLRANVDATRREPVEPALAEELAGWYQEKVRPEIRGRI